MCFAMHAFRNLWNPSIFPLLCVLYGGECMENSGFIGFDTNLKRILEEVVNQLGQRYTGDKLQQEFYQLQQEKGEKI